MSVRRKPWSDEDKIKARERDRERKRRDQLTPSQLTRVRYLDKENKKVRRKILSETEKDKHFNEIKELNRIKTLLRVRKLRSNLSEAEKQVLRDSAREKMSWGRKKGFLKKYKHRKKRDPNHLVIWKNYFRSVNPYGIIVNDAVDLFIMEHPKLKNTHEELKVLSKQVREMENKSREEAHRYRRMRPWNPRPSYLKKDESFHDEDDEDDDIYSNFDD